MSEKSIENLIDLNEDDEEQHSASANQTKSMNLQTVMEERESLDNNPFDLAQKLALRPQDPFDIVEKEACVKARYSMHQSHEIKMGNLLSLSDDNILDAGEQQREGDAHVLEDSATEKETQMACADNMTPNIGSSTIYHTALIHDLDNESPPITMSMKSTPDSCSSAIESDESSANSADGYSAKMRKALESRKRLLKLSIANSTFNSPLSCRTRPGDSGFSTAFTAAAHFSDHMLATESPLKLVEDDGMTEVPPKTAEQNFEADLQMLSIPMLRKLPSPVPEEQAMSTKAEYNEAGSVPPNMTPADLTEIREKLRVKRLESGKDQHVLSLIDNLKSLLCGNDIVDEYKKGQANSLLQKLSTALNAAKPEDIQCDTEQQNADNMESSSMKVPQTIVRQGTFDMELQPSANENCDNSTVIPAITVNGDISRMTHSLQSTHSLSPPKEIPEAMLKSSATYDSEPIAERESLLLPYVETISPITSPQNNKPAAILNEASTSNPDINDIIEQISKLFEQHQIATQTPNSDGTYNNNEPAGSNASQTSTNYNPTFIVVMPSNNMQCNNGQNVSTHCDGFFDDINSNSAMRRRSQSLSLHDKVKFVQLPIRPKASATETDSSPLAADVMMPQNNTATIDIRTPIRTQRRNSFSLGTPHTPLTSLHPRAGLTNNRRLPNASIQSRYSLGPCKTEDTQHQALVHPIPRAANLNAFKPDLKKRTKLQTAKTSVMTSKAPLKAVMPIKKVAPLLTSTLATPERPTGSARLQSQKASMETSMHLLTTSGKISNTSTPMSSARNSEQINGIPNAYSSPAFSTSANAARLSGTLTKRNSRFSNLTPTSKLQQPHASTNSAIKKRALPELSKAKSPVQAVKGRQSMKLPNIPKQTESRLSIRPNSMRASCGGYETSLHENCDEGGEIMAASKPIP